MQALIVPHERIALVIAHVYGGAAADYLVKGQVDLVVVNDSIDGREHEAATYQCESSVQKHFAGIDYADERGVHLMKGQPPVDILLFFLGGDYIGIWTAPRQNARKGFRAKPLKRR